MEKLLIIDGNNLLFQMFYGMPSKIYNKSGQTIHATIGFVSAILRLYKMVEATKIVVVFDCDGSEERKEAYDDYKANRIINWDELPSDEVPFNEEEKIKKCLESMGIKYLDSKDMEADDLIASLVYLFKEKNKIYISSYDSDFYQLIDKNVSIIRYKGKNSKIIDEDEFVKMFSFTPNKYVFYKSLLGDNSDNIKGIELIGKKRATMIVKRCVDYDDLIGKADELFPSKVANNIKESKAKFVLNKSIISLTHKLVVNYDIREFMFNKDILSLTNSQILSINGVFD